MLRVEGVRVSRAGGEIVSDVSFEVTRGEVVALLGPSGAGKSTLLGSIAGEITPDAGGIRLLGKSLPDEPLYRRARRGIGFLPQGPNSLLDLTVRQNISTFAHLVDRTFGKRADGADGAGAAGGGTETKALRLAERLELSEKYSERVRNISGGERRRLEVLRTLLADPVLLLCDEPFAGIDPVRAACVADLLREAAQAGAAIVLSDHHVGHALRVADRALLILGGKVLVDAKPAEFVAHAMVREHYLGPVLSQFSPHPRPVALRGGDGTGTI